MPSFNVSRTILGLTAIAAALPVAGTLASAQSLLSGDVAIIGTYNETAAEFSWVPLVDLPAGEVIYFSDAGYSFAADAFQGTDRTEEWLLRYVAPAGGVAAGTVQTVVDGTSPADYDGPGMSTEFGARDLGPTIDLSMTGLGDELIAFQSADDPTQATFGQTSFTALFQTDPGSFTRPLFTFDDTAVTHTTDVAPGLTVGQNAVGLRDDGNDDEFDNIRYIGSVSGTQAELLAAISDSANWEGTNDEQIEGWTSSLGGGTFDVLPDGPMLVTNVTQGTQFVKLQDALNNAVTGDAIEIAAGTLFESLIIWPQDLSVSILGAGPGQTIIDGQYEATLMVMVGNDTTIEGITSRMVEIHPSRRC